MQQEKEAAGSGGGGTWDLAVAVADRKKPRRRKEQRKIVDVNHYDENEDDENGEGGERQREHPFIVTEPGEVARGKKNGLDYLFHLYEQCRDFLIQVQNIAKERGEKCPTKVTFFKSTPSTSSQGRSTIYNHNHAYWTQPTGWSY